MPDFDGKLDIGQFVVIQTTLARGFTIFSYVWPIQHGLVMDV
jgi:hypothetical protein